MHPVQLMGIVKSVPVHVAHPEYKARHMGVVYVTPKMVLPARLLPYANAEHMVGLAGAYGTYRELHSGPAVLIEPCHPLQSLH